MAEEMKSDPGPVPGEAEVVPAPLLPICPYCSADPFPLATIPMTNPESPIGFFIFFCGACRKVTNVVRMNTQPQVVIPPNGMPAPRMPMPWEKR